MHSSICSHILGCIAYVHTYICPYIREREPKVYNSVYCTAYFTASPEQD